MKIVNPVYKIQNETDNIFTIREKEYQHIEELCREILKPAEELGFEVVEFGIKDSKFSSGELFKTLKKNLIIRLKRGQSDIDLSMSIPTLIDRNYIMIGGRRKIPLFQLFDVPFVTRGKTVKMRTNVTSLMVFEEKESPFIHLSIFGKRIPLSLAIFTYFGLDKTRDMFDLVNLKINPDTCQTTYEKLLLDLKEYFETSKDYSKGDFISEVGRYFSNYDYKVKGENLIYGLDLILKTDIISAKFFQTGSVLGDLIEVLKIGEIDDTNFENKRIRCFEYVILNRVSKAVFDFCMANRTTKNAKFNINSSQILSNCNVSNIIQFDFAINPIEELTMLSRTSLVGPEGFSKENVPYYLRDIQPSMFGRICPVDTPDRDNCGILQSLVPNVDLDENLKFTPVIRKEQPISIPVSMVPFLKNDDQTRLQMASSQMRQSIMLLDFDQPMIKTGCEGLYTDYTQFVKRAKNDGSAIFSDSEYIIIAYDDGEIDLISVSLKKIYVENVDAVEVYVSEGMRVSKGDIIAESNYCKNGEINIGKNLLTAIVPFHGYNYEDGIVISDRLVKENTFTSMHVKELNFVIPESKILLSLDKNSYKPLPVPGLNSDKKKQYDFIASGKPYAILKEMPGNILDFNSVFKEEIPLIEDTNLFITDVNIYVNSYNTEIPQYVKWVEETQKKQIEQEQKIQNIIYQKLPKPEALQFIRENNLDKFSHSGKYKIKGEEINGIYVEMTALYLRNIEVGDKVGNRHGNKGVISKILPHDQMPKLEDGRNVDICINPMGILSRMNVGQVFEAHLAMSLNDFKNQLLNIFHSDKDQIEKDNTIKQHLCEYIQIIDNTKDNWYFTQFQNELEKTEITEKFINDLTLVTPPFESPTYKMILKALEYTNTKEKYKLFDSILGKDILQDVCVGFMYFFRMVHIAEHKISYRSISMYNRKTLQATAGRKNQGGQRLGEMECNALVGHDALENLNECLTTKSDCIDLKNEYIKSVIDVNYTKDESLEVSKVPEAVNLLKNYLLVTGVDMN